MFKTLVWVSLVGMIVFFAVGRSPELHETFFQLQVVQKSSAYVMKARSLIAEVKKLNEQSNGIVPKMLKDGLAKLINMGYTAPKK